jgi:hypothetical protein
MEHSQIAHVKWNNSTAKLPSSSTCQGNTLYTATPVSNDASDVKQTLVKDSSQILRNKGLKNFSSEYSRSR